MRCARHLQGGHSIWLAGDSTLMYLRCCSWWCQIGVKAHALCWGQWGSNPHEFRVRGRWDRNRTCNLRFWRPNPWCRAVSPHAALPHSRCRRVSPHVAGCRRSLGQILGQPMLLRALFSLLCVSDSGSTTMRSKIGHRALKMELKAT